MSNDIVSFTYMLRVVTNNLFFFCLFTVHKFNMNRWRDQLSWTTLTMTFCMRRLGARCIRLQSYWHRTQHSKANRLICGRWVWFCSQCWWASTRSTRRMAECCSSTSVILILPFQMCWVGTCVALFVPCWGAALKKDWLLRTSSTIHGWNPHRDPFKSPIRSSTWIPMITVFLSWHPWRTMLWRWAEYKMLEGHQDWIWRN